MPTAVRANFRATRRLASSQGRLGSTTCSLPVTASPTTRDRPDSESTRRSGIPVAGLLVLRPSTHFHRPVSDPKHAHNP